MRANYIHIRNFTALWPSWLPSPFPYIAIVDVLLEQCGFPFSHDKSLNFGIGITPSTGYVDLQTFDGEGEDKSLRGKMWIDGPSPFCDAARVVLPLNEMAKGARDLLGSHCLYAHVAHTETPLVYLGITRQEWHARAAQHARAAVAGSPYLFHAAIRRHRAVRWVHDVWLAGISEEDALRLEEEFVAGISLYPLGLNMIPGGKAGFAYLSRLGLKARNAAERDAALAGLVLRETVNGAPNPLCAARWAADQEYANRVICGHSGRLTVEQVRAIRLHADFGTSASDIESMLAVSRRRVAAVVRGRRYGRVR